MGKPSWGAGGKGKAPGKAYGKGPVGGKPSWGAPPVQKPWIKPAGGMIPAWSGKGAGAYAAPKGKGKIGKSAWSAPAMPWQPGGKASGKSFSMPTKGVMKGVMKGLTKGFGKGSAKVKGKTKSSPPKDSEFWTTKMESENRQVLEGSFEGIVSSYNIKHGWGFIKPDNPELLPLEVQSKLAEMAVAELEKGKTVSDEQLLYFRKPDILADFKASKDAAVAFSVYIDDKGAGACEVTG